MEKRIDNDFSSIGRFSVTLATIKSNSLSIPISIENAERNENVETLGLIDSGAGGEFIDQNYVKSAGFKTQLLVLQLRRTLTSSKQLFVQLSSV